MKTGFIPASWLAKPGRGRNHTDWTASYQLCPTKDVDRKIERLERLIQAHLKTLRSLHEERAEIIASRK